MAIEADLVGALACWGIRANDVVGCEPVSGNGAVRLVELGSGERFVLKDVTADAGGLAQRSRLEQQYRLQLHLQRSGVPVAALGLTTDGHSYAEHEGRLYTLAPYIANNPHMTREQEEAHYRDTGVAIGKLHRALGTYEGEIESWHMALEPRFFEQALPAVVGELAGDERAWLAERARQVEPEMRRTLAGLPEQRIHGDCHGGNVLFHAGRVVGFVDLDHLPVGPRVYGLAYNLVHMVKWRIHDPAATANWLSHISEVVAGYESVIPLLQAEKQALSPLMLGIQLLFAEWFFAHADPDSARLNLAAFDWFYEHGAEIRRALPLPPAIGHDRTGAARHHRSER